MLVPRTRVTFSMTRNSLLQLSVVTPSNSFRVFLRDDSRMDLVVPLSFGSCKLWNSDLEKVMTRPVEKVVPNRHELALEKSSSLRASTELWNRATNSDSNGGRFPNGWASQ